MSKALFHDDSNDVVDKDAAEDADVALDDCVTRSQASEWQVATTVWA